MTVEEYIQNINQRFKLGNATEHTFRGDLQQLIESVVTGIKATNEPKRQKCGAPDYILTKKEIPVGFIEAKDIGDNDLDGKRKSGNKEQFDRYKASLNNLIFTDYINFHLYQDGEFVTAIAIGEITEEGIKPLSDNFSNFENLLKDFCTHVGQTIKSSKKLAAIMAGKARLLADIIGNALTSDEEKEENSTLKEQMLAFKDVLIHDITPKGFADVYAQTIAYGMFAARLHDPTLENFTRQEAAELIPRSNPFLRKLFGYIAGPDIDDRIKWVVENLSEIFLACNVEEILKNYGKSTKMEDPIIHFYETFLSEYDSKLRKSRGVWYTPQPVVDFIIRAVDDILKTEFDLPHGLADTSKTKILRKHTTKATADQRSKLKEVEIEEEVHKVQILDPATGTGTFLAEVVKHIYKGFRGQQGIWTNYVENQLLPRLNGFELLMASYAMAHLKLDLLLTETGFKPTSNQRFKVYLTNSLEESHPDTGTLFANWLSTEANEANYIKRDTPVMCVIGNPPYSGVSSNRGEWIMNLMDDYKKEPASKEKLNERNPKMVNDDYVKFIRYGQHFIDKNGNGILAFINPHGFLDSPTFRGMRWNLLKSFDKIYTVDLHGNSKKKETTPDGNADFNVFDIQQGVSINIFLKTGEKKVNELGTVFHYDLYGKRNDKYEFLSRETINTIGFNKLPNVKPQFYFVPKDFKGKARYETGFQLSKLFGVNTSGIKTHRDSFVIDIDKNSLKSRIGDFYSNSIDNSDILSNYNLKASQEWLDKKRKGVFDETKIRSIVYRPFDLRSIYFSEDLVDRGRFSVMHHFSDGQNYGIALNRQIEVDRDFYDVFITSELFTLHSLSLKEGNYIAPLYLYPESNGQQTIQSSNERIPNLNSEIIANISENLGLAYKYEQEETKDIFAPIDLLDYIYAVLHSPTYRKKYKEFLKIDFPRIPYPKRQDIFWQLVKLGGEIRQIHLFEKTRIEQYITNYPIDGNNIITKKITKSSPGYVAESETHGKVYINDNQFFDNVPQIAWEFYIGGYQPAQKWLKDRKNRKLDYSEILHYQKIIVALAETDRLMKEIDKIKIG